jgi:hypothetical protein
MLAVSSSSCPAQACERGSSTVTTDEPVPKRAASWVFGVFDSPPFMSLDLVRIIVGEAGLFWSRRLQGSSFPFFASCFW